METSAEFDLNSAIKRWQEDLDQSPHFHTEDREELEAHLRDSVSKLRAAGLSDQEAFLIASKRIGSVKELEPEFAKASRRSRWHKRLAKSRAYFLVLNLVLSAWITPDGNPLTMALLALLLQAVFEVIVICDMKERLYKVIHGLTAVFFSLACWLLWVMLTLVQTTTARILPDHPTVLTLPGGANVVRMTTVRTLSDHGLPGFSQLCLESRPILWVLPLLATAYCLFILFRKTDLRKSWIGFFAASMTALVLLLIPTMIAVCLPVVAILDRMSNK